MDKKVNKTIPLILYTLIHFAVDLSCLFYITSQVRSICLIQTDMIMLAILYNFCAFALPMGMGLLSDYVDRNDFLAAIGCILIAAVYLLNLGARADLAGRQPVHMLVPPVLACIILGIGNGLFHIGSGRQVLQDAAGRYSAPGIFIASGAVGVFIGRTYGSPFYGWLYFLLLAAILVFAIVLTWFGIIRNRKEETGKKQSFLKNTFTKEEFRAIPSWGVFSLFIVVIIRSFYGCVVTYTWNNKLLIGFIFTGCVFAGKFLGGIVADRIGVKAASIVSLGGAGILVLFSANNAVLGCIAILLFNMTMPMTLTLLAEYWKKFPGFAFGTLMMALFLGTLPTMAFRVPMISNMFYAFSFCILSMVVLINAILLRKKQ